MFVYYRPSNYKKKTAVAIYLAVAIPLMFVVPSFVGGQLPFSVNRLVFKGVPVSIIVDFLLDETARSAYFRGNKQLLHDRLGEMGVEEKVKDFYRPQGLDEQQLDQHIHQIFYDNTGYVGTAYRVNLDGILVRKNL